MYKTITIYFLDGTKEEYYGDLSISDKGILNIFPQNGRMSTKIPIAQIKKYEVS